MSQGSAAAILTKAREAAIRQKPFVVKSYKLPPKTESQLEDILEVFLAQLNRRELRDSLGYCLRELAVNGKKANTKRVYFEEKTLDLQSDHDYEKGMRTFKSETLDNIEYWLGKQEEAGLYVKIAFQIQGRDLHVRVANNTIITRKEQIRIYDRIARSRAFRSMEEAMTSVIDDSEGAGLGIVILVLMLKKIGLDEEAFDIDVEAGETVARLAIPMDVTKREHLDSISEELVDHINSLPQFPESIIGLQKLLENPDATVSEIARVLGQDPALTADLLRTVNSARYMLPGRIDNVVEAIKIVGFRGLKQMLYSYGTQRVLGDGSDNDVAAVLWEHSQRTAFYSYGIARGVLKRKDILDDVYVGAILHDIGKVVFSNLQPEVVKHIQRFANSRGIPASIFEEMANGIDHAEVGARLAERWNFPAPLAAAIRFHHAPLKAPQQYREAISVIYTANELANLEHGKYDLIDARPVRIVGVSSYQQLRAIHERLTTQYEAQASRYLR